MTLVTIGSSVERRDSISAAYGPVLFYSSVVTPEDDLFVRSHLPIQSVQSLMEESYRLRIVLLPMQNAVRQITSHKVTDLHVTYTSPHPVRRVKVPTVNGTAGYVQAAAAYSILTVPRYPSPSDSLSSCTSVACVEEYLQKAPYKELIDGTYNYSVPEHLREQWNRLFNTRADLVKESMRHVWKNYRKYAWGHDELQPLSGKGRDNWGGIGMTLIDSLDTLWVMDMKEEFEEAVQWLDQNWELNSNFTISVFEFTIRIIGGLLSAFYLSGDERLKRKAILAGDLVMAAFPNVGLPHVG